MLSDTKIRAIKPAEKRQKLSDGLGLYLDIRPNGSRLWRFKYRIHGREKLISFGRYPDVSLKKARSQRDDARALVADGVDPSAKRRADRAATENTFEVIAREWYAKESATWVPSYSKKVIARLEKNVFPWIGSTPIKTTTRQDVLSVLRRVEKRGAVESAHRILRYCGSIFRYGVNIGLLDADPSVALGEALAVAESKSHATIVNPARVGELLRALHGYAGTAVVQAALKLAPLVFLRPGELRHAEWVEFDLELREWRIPAERMKMRRPHMVPLSEQAVTILRELEPLTRTGRYVFPSNRGKDRPMSANTVNAALRRLGYEVGEMTGHGFRAMASTLLHEQKWLSDAIERQLAHVEGNKSKAPYNYAEHIDERKKMMQAWADYLDALQSGANVIPIGASRSA